MRTEARFEPDGPLTGPLQQHSGLPDERSQVDSVPRNSDLNHALAQGTVRSDEIARQRLLFVVSESVKQKVA